ncbi:MAG TPA: DegT/DnrJ/EryC1/StrS family aminotransferase, partial [Verrucomicrobiae bacterium]|nr:DegT/DnrJ/EryC1/StrS family aminotransferase [Verrucomicrobiae bacterium]
RNARLYDEKLRAIGVEPPKRITGEGHVYHLYVIELDDRDAARQALADEGIATGLHYPIPIHLQPAYAELGYARGDFPVTERAAGRILSLPMFPELTEAQIDRVVDGLQRSIAKR